MSILNVENLSYSFNSKLLYKNANLKINRNEHIVLLGPNGSGKSTFMKLINHELSPDEGSITIAKNIQISYLDQHLEVDDTMTVIQFLQNTFHELYEIESKINQLYETIAIQYDEKKLDQATALQDKLNTTDFYDINKKINNIILGLNIEKNLINRKLNTLSSGQKSKVLLAKLLLGNNDLLLIDEPTNFLDIDQVKWLSDFLNNYKGAFLVISHDFTFVNKIANIIYEINNNKFNRYSGNFTFFLEQKDQKDKQYILEYKMQQKKIEKLQTYISKNIAKASLAKSAKSRQKQLNKIEVMAKPKTVTLPKFHFNYKKTNHSSAINVHSLVIGYDKPLARPINFTIRDKEKWLIKGHNGIGKSTLLKTILGVIPSLSGKVDINEKIVIGHFFQELEEYLDLTPITYFKNQNENLTDSEIRSILSNFMIKNDLIFKNIRLLSGGEQTKIQLAYLAINKSTLLMLDEPTNHLDNLAKKSLLKAINEFEGVVIMTSHDNDIENSWTHNVLDLKNFSN